MEGVEGVEGVLDVFTSPAMDEELEFERGGENIFFLFFSSSLRDMVSHHLFATCSCNAFIAASTSRE